MPLKKNEIEKYKKTLLKMRNELVHVLNETNQEVKEGGESKGYSQHSADEGTDDFVKSINLEVSNKGFGVLREIERALEKIEEGNYGICDISGDEIPKKRLDAVPYATMTVESQEKLEREKGAS